MNWSKSCKFSLVTFKSRPVAITVLFSGDHGHKIILKGHQMQKHSVASTGFWRTCFLSSQTMNNLKFGWCQIFRGHLCQVIDNFSTTQDKIEAMKVQALTIICAEE